MAVLQKAKKDKKGFIPRFVNKIGKSDLIKGAVVAGGSAAAMYIQPGLDSLIETGQFTTADPKTIAMAAVGGFCTYLLKNIFWPKPKA